MNTNLLDTLKQIVSQYGVETLDDSKRMNGFLSDLAPKEPKGERKALIACLAGAYHQELSKTAPAERPLCKSRLARKLHDDEGFDAALCADTITLLEEVFKELEKKNVAEETAADTVEQNETPQPTPGVNQELSDNPAAITAQANEIERLEKANNEVNTALVAKETEIERLTTERNQSNREKREFAEKLEKTKKGLIAAIVVGGIALIGWIIMGVNNSETISSLQWLFNDSSAKLSSLQTNYDSLVSDYESLESDFNKSKELWAINITSLKVGNWNNNQWITEPGGTLSASQMRNLWPRITYDSLMNEKVTLFIKIIKPDGTVLRNTSESPEGYTYSTTEQISRGKDRSFSLSFGYGNSSESAYSSGLWTVEIWYNGVCLRSEKVQIN
jgi:hypothetical protein